MKKIVIVGSKGMAGHVINFHLKENTNYQIVSIARDTQFFTPDYQVDVADFLALEMMLSKEKPDFVVNCIGVLNQEAENAPDKSILLNSYLPHFLAKKGSEIGYKLIHISTDCVFSGKTGGYTEDSLKDGKGYYAQSKALGEVLYGNNVTLRTSIIGPELKQNGIGLFHWFMNQTGQIRGYTNAYWTGITTIELSKAIVKVIEQDLGGLYHLVNSEKLSKFNLLSLFKKILELQDVVITEYADYHVDKSLIRTDNIFQYEVPGYETMIQEMKHWIIKHSHLYQYKL